jgi:hypothetical protein
MNKLNINKLTKIKWSNSLITNYQLTKLVQNKIKNRIALDFFKKKEAYISKRNSQGKLENIQQCIHMKTQHVKTYNMKLKQYDGRIS